MSRAKLGPCPACGSRDNLARYPDGSAWCFGCHYWERSDAQHLSRLITRADTAEAGTPSREISPKVTGTTAIGMAGVSWLAKYGISVQEALRAGLRWDEARKQLIFHYYDQNGKLACTQAKNFDPFWAAKSKYFNRGAKEEAFPLFKCQAGEGQHCSAAIRPTWLVITEDGLSAIKLSRQIDAMPALGTSMSINKITALAKLGYQGVYIWLDRDKWKEGVEMADKFKWLGLSTKAIYTEKDPKEYSDEELRNYLCPSE